MKNIFAYVSSWTHGAGETGIGLYRMNPERGTLEFLGMENNNADFNMTYFDKTRHILYACNETPDLPGMSGGGGRIFAYKIDNVTGHLTQIDCKPTWCPNPSYLPLDASGRYMIVSNHSVGATATKIRKDAFGKYYLDVVASDAVVELFALNPNGTFGELLDVVYHSGNGPEKRQRGPHPHCAVMSPDGRFFAVCDKGNDTVRFYTIENGKLVLPAMPVCCPPGTMPRYAAFHPTLPYFYHNNESATELDSYRYDPDGKLTRIGSVSVLPTDSSSQCVETLEQQGLAMHPNGKFLYDVLRGPNVIVALTIGADGVARPIQHLATGGSWPRGCNLTADGTYFGLCCVKSSTVSLYRVQPDGTLQTTGSFAHQNGAAYITFCEI